LAGAARAQVPARQAIPEVHDPIRIDGRLEPAEWKAARVHKLDSAQLLIDDGARSGWRGAADLSAELRVAYDSAHLYLGGDVADDSFVAQRDASQWESGDAIELYVGVVPQKDASSGAPGADASTGVRLCFMPFHEQRPWGQLAWDGRASGQNALTGSTLTGVKIAFQPQGAGRYSFEVQVPFHALLSVESPAPVRLRFAVALHDHDDGRGGARVMTLDGRRPDQAGTDLTMLEFGGAPPLTDSRAILPSWWTTVRPWLSLLLGPLLAASALWLLLRAWSSVADDKPRMRRAGRVAAAIAFAIGLLAPRVALDLRESSSRRTLEGVLGALREGIPEMEKGTLASYAGAQREQQLLELLRGHAIPRRRYFDYVDLGALAEGSFGYGPRRYPGEFFDVRPYFIPLPLARTERIDFRKPVLGQRLLVVVSMPQPVLEFVEPTPPRLRVQLEHDSGSDALDLTFHGPRASASAFDRDRRDMVYELVELRAPLLSVSFTALAVDGVELVGLSVVDDDRAPARPLDLGQPALTGVPASLRGPYPEDSGIELRAGERRARLQGNVAAGYSAEGFDRAWLIYRAEHPGVLPDDLLTNATVGEVAVHFVGSKVPPRVVVLQHQRNVLFERSRNNQVQAPLPGSNAHIAYAWKDEAGERHLNLVTEIELPRDQTVEAVTFRVGSHYPIRFRAMVFGREQEAAPSDAATSPLTRIDPDSVRLREDFAHKVRAASFAMYRDARLVAVTAEGGAPDSLPGELLADAALGLRATRDQQARVYESFLPLTGSGWRDNVLGVFVRDPVYERFSRAAYSIGLALCLLAVPVLLLMLAEAIAAFSSLRVRLVAALAIATLAPLAVLAWLVLRVVEEGHETQQRQRLLSVLDGVGSQLSTLQRDLTLSAEAWLAALVEDAQARLAGGATPAQIRAGLQQRMASQRPPEWKGGFLRLELTPAAGGKGMTPLTLFDGDAALRGLETPLRPEPSVFVAWGAPVLGVRRELEAEIGSAALSVARPIDSALLARLLPGSNAILCDVFGYPLTIAASQGVSTSWLERMSCRAAVMAARREAMVQGQQSGGQQNGRAVFTPHDVDSEPWIAAYSVLRDVDATPRALLGVVDVARPASLPLPVGRVSVRGFLLAVAAVLLLFAVSLSSVVTNRISRPIEQLARGAQALGHGDLDVRVEPTETDGHLARLTQAFNRMAQDLRGRIGDLRILHVGMQDLTSKLELREALATTVRLFMQHSPAHRVRVLLRDHAADGATLYGDEQVSMDGNDPVVRTMLLAVGPFCVRGGEPSAVARPRLPEALAVHARSLLGLPLAVAGRVRGAVLLLFDTDVPKPVNLELLTTLSTQAALAMENACLYMAAVEDPYTGAYVADFFRRRVAQDVANAQAQAQPVSMLGIAFLDGDRLQDSLGADRLARCIERVTRGVRGALGTAVAIGRWSSSELRVLLPGAGLERGGEIVREVSALLAQVDLGLPPEWVPLRTAVVAATFPGEAASAEFLLDAIEQRLEAARQPILAASPAPAIALDDTLVASSAGMQHVLRTLQRVAPTDIAILIEGETGTGKELLADLAHRWSRRRGGPLVKVHCAAIPETLLQSELFGYEKGAFTGAEARKLGKFELARGGTVFLDEIGEVPLEVQVKLLRVLQQREIDRVGGLHPVPVDVRIVAATNKSLRDLVARGQFREDLYYRLQGMTLSVPPLRERRDEIPALVERFCAEARALGQTSVRGFTTDALDAIHRHAWPGNVRELRNAVVRAAVLASGEWIEPAHLTGLVPLGPAAAPPKPGSSVGEATVFETIPPDGAIVVTAQGSGDDRSTPVVVVSTSETAAARGRAERLLALIAARGEISVDDHVRDAGVSPRTALRDLSDLIRQRRIERTGIRRGARYRMANTSVVSAVTVPGST
jgi:transcriptional regulator with GAF, ATPase, and Fis domain